METHGSPRGLPHARPLSMFLCKMVAHLAPRILGVVESQHYTSPKIAFLAFSLPPGGNMIFPKQTYDLSRNFIWSFQKLSVLLESSSPKLSFHLHPDSCLISDLISDIDTTQCPNQATSNRIACTPKAEHHTRHSITTCLGSQ